MRIPQVTGRIKTGRIKEAPTHALRAVFGGIGQLLIVADRIRKQAQARATAAPAGPGSEPGAGPRPGAKPAAKSAAKHEPAPERPGRGRAGRSGLGAGERARAGQPKASPAQPRWRSLDKTGNVRLLSAEDQAGDLPDPSGSAALDETEPAAALPAAALDEPAASAEPAALADSAESARSIGDASLPVPNYDSLSLPSLRARLRALDASQVRVLAEYERSHAGRADVVAMFERRIVKLAAEGGRPSRRTGQRGTGQRGTSHAARDQRRGARPGPDGHAACRRLDRAPRPDLGGRPDSRAEPARLHRVHHSAGPARSGLGPGDLHPRGTGGHGPDSGGRRPGGRLGKTGVQHGERHVRTDRD